MLFAGVQAALAGDTVQMSLHCLSLRFAPAQVRMFGLIYTEAIGRSGSDPVNGELGLSATTDYTHEGYLRLEFPDSVEPAFVPFVLDIPQSADANGNGVRDFFEVEQPVASVKSTGAYFDPNYGDYVLMKASWSRSEGSKDGECQLELTGLGMTFKHAFELIQLDGVLTYTNSGTNLTGWVELAQNLNPDNRLHGPMSLSRVDADRLLLVEGAWTNATEQTMSYRPVEPLDRAQTNYLAFFAFDDGDPSTQEPDYGEWLLRIVDTRDSDGNGVPDLSDVVAPPKAPRLALRREDKSLLLTIDGEAGRPYDIEATPTLSQPNWAAALTVTLTNTVQTVQVPLPGTDVAFWRAHAR